MATSKPKSFLSTRRSGIQPSSASDDDFAQVLGQVSPQAAAHPVFSQNLPLERIRPNPFQARVNFEGLDELAEVIRVQGFISRLRVRPDPQDEGFFQLVYGERRLRAAKLAGLSQLPCDVSTHTDREMIEIGLAENIQRYDLSPLEEANAFNKFIEEGSYTIRELAERLGKNKDYIAGRLALLRAPQDVQQLVARRPDSVTVARRIAQLKTAEERQPLIEAVLSGTLNKEGVRTIVQQIQQLEAQVVRPDVQAVPQNRPAISSTNPGEATSTTLLPTQSPASSNKVEGPTSSPNPTNFVRPDVQSATKAELQKLERESATILTILGRWQKLELEPATQHKLLELLQNLESSLQRVKAAIE